MKTSITVLVLFLSYLTMNAQIDTLSYSIGVIVAQNLEKQGISGVNNHEVANGIAHVLNSENLLISEAEADVIFSEYVESLKQKKYKVNKEAGEKFLMENSQKEGIVTLESGLQYEVLTEGDGAKPTIKDKVNVHYHGLMIDGTVFDSSVDRGEPISFPLGNVIEGWQEGLQQMSVGSKYKLYIPYNLAYGERSAGPVIKPFSALIFEVELLAIE